MMTLEEFMTRKGELETRMWETRQKAAHERADVDEMRTRQLLLLHRQYCEQRERVFRECRQRCEEITERYRRERMQLYVQDQALVASWRGQLKQEGGAA